MRFFDTFKRLLAKYSFLELLYTWMIACHVMSRFEIYFGSTKESFQRANPFENCLTTCMSFVSIT